MYMYFDFKCDTCDHRFEKMVKRDTLPHYCPNCGATTIRKILSAPGGFSFKGVKATVSMNTK